MTAASPAARARGYYDGPDLNRTVFDALERAGLDAGRIEIDDLAAMDEFHALGRAGTVALAARSDLVPGLRVLDAGAGIGGPARFLAARHGARVVALDATERFCRVSEALCRATGLADRVEVLCGDATEMPLPDASFDRAWTQALIQSVPDKRALLGELRRVLVPGGLLSMFEVLRRSQEPLHYPVPWGDGPEESFLVDAAELRELAEDAGFAVREWLPGEQAVAAVGAAAAEVPAPRREIDLSLLMPDYEARMASIARNIGEGRIELAIAVLAAR